MDSEADDEEPTQTAEEREERLRNLVPGLAPGEWGADSKDDQDENDDVEMAPSQPSTQMRGTVAGSAYGDSLLPPKMRPPMFESVHYDGVESDSSDEEDEADLPPKGTLGRHISDMKWGDGEMPEATIEELDEDGGEEEEEEEKERREEKKREKALKFDDDIDEQMRRRVWGAEEEDDKMDEDEDGGLRDDGMEGDQTAEFLKFARDALGIDETMWSAILAQRRERGGEYKRVGG